MPAPRLVTSPPCRVLLILGVSDIYQAGDAVPEITPFGLSAVPFLVAIGAVLMSGFLRWSDVGRIAFVEAPRYVAADALAIGVTASGKAKCERCWHYRADVGTDDGHPHICGRCVSNLHGDGELRTYA